MRWEEYDPGTPGPGEVRLHQEAVGLNFIDVYHRTGLYPLPALPAVLGLEGAGIVESVGSGVSEFKPGDRVAYAGIPPGAYAQERCIPAHRLVRLPDNISTRQAAGMMLRGMTARYLLYGCHPVKAYFVLTPEARSDIEQILLGIAADNPRAAERLRSELWKALQTLARSPGFGHYHEELLSRRFRFWNFYSYVVAYAWEPRPIQIISVVHAARDLAIFHSLRTPRGS